MNLEKLTRIGCIALGVLGLIFLAIVFASGDDSIKMAAASGNYGVITPSFAMGDKLLNRLKENAGLSFEFKAK